jgi:hypothetical protein
LNALASAADVVEDALAQRKPREVFIRPQGSSVVLRRKGCSGGGDIRLVLPSESGKN